METGLVVQAITLKSKETLFRLSKNDLIESFDLKIKEKNPTISRSSFEFITILLFMVVETT